MKTFISDEEMRVLEQSGALENQLSGRGITGAMESFNQGAEDVLRGAAKGVGSTLFGIGKVGEMIVNPVERALGVKETKLGEKPEFLKPQGLAQNIGYGAEQIAEFLIPASKISKASTFLNRGYLATRAPKIIQKGFSLAARSTLEAGAAGGQRFVQTGDVGEAKTAALVGAAFPILGAVVSGTGKLLGATGRKIQQTVIRPNARDFADGFKIENVSRYGVGGSLSETVTKSHVKMNQLSQELSKKLSGSDAALNLNRVLLNTRKALIKSKPLDFGENQAIKRVLKQVKAEIDEVAGPNGLVDLVEANMVKRGAGTKGAWAFGRVDPDAGAIEKVYSAFYRQLRVAIEKAAPEGIRGINKQLSELIPISNAALRRLPIEQRNNVLGLTDSIGLFASVFDPRALALIGASRLSKSGKFGNFLVNVASGFKNRSEIGRRFIP